MAQEEPTPPDLTKDAVSKATFTFSVSADGNLVKTTKSDESNEKSKGEEEEPKEGHNEEEDASEGPDVHFEPLITLDKIDPKTNEEDEDVIFKMRAKLFRYTKNEWKERGTGDVRFLKHKDSGKIRLVMRRDKTHKICANHYILPSMSLTSNIGSDRSWVWTVMADMSEGSPSSETLAIRFANSENANMFKEKFIESQEENKKAFEK